MFIPSVEDIKVRQYIIDSLLELGLTDRELCIWKVTTGMLKFEPGSWASELRRCREQPIADFKRALDYVSSHRKTIGIFYHIRHLLVEADVRQSIIDAAYQAKRQFSAVIFVGAYLDLPPELYNLITYVDFPLPNQKELEQLFTRLVSNWEKKNNVLLPRTPRKQQMLIRRAASSALGLDTFSAENALALTASISGTLDTKIIQAQKEQHIKKSDVLEYFQPSETLDDIGGFGELKKWIAMRKEAFTERAQKYGLSWPKGILLIGEGGTGKSYCAKCVANFLELPLLRLDMGSVFSRFQGDSEARMRQALSVAEAIAPCVTGNTLIRLSSGKEVTASDLFYNTKEYPHTVSIESWDEQLGKVVSSNLVGISKKFSSYHGCYEIITPSGSFSRTGNHQILTQEGWMKVSKLKPGVHRIATRVGPAKQSYKVPIHNVLPINLRVGKDGKYRMGRGGFTDSIVNKIPNTVTDSMFYLLGLAMSDGTIRNSYISWRSSNKGLIDFIQTTISDLFGIKIPTYLNSKPGHISSKLDGTKIISTKQSYQIRGHRIISHIFRTLSNYLLSVPIEQQLCWLRGFIEGDGCVLPKTNRIILGQKNIEVSNALKVILRNMKIPRRYINNRITISGYNNYNYVIDVLRSCFGYKNDKISKSEAPAALNQKGFSRGVYASELSDDIIFSLVTDVKRLNPQDVFDLHCDGPHTYIGDGFIDHNCVLWVDELDKAVSGVASSGYGDSGVTARVVSTLLTWRQETTKPVFMVCTANDPEMMPSMVYRKGRLDEIWAVSLPSAEERVEILKVHLKKRKRDPDQFNLSLLGTNCVGFTGAEIEAAVEDAMFTSFYNDEALSTEHILTAFEQTTPQSSIETEDSIRIQRWLAARARPVSSSAANKI